MNTALGSDSKLIIGADLNQLDHHSIPQTGLHTIFWFPPTEVNPWASLILRGHTSRHIILWLQLLKHQLIQLRKTSSPEKSSHFAIVILHRVVPAFNISTTSTSTISPTSASSPPTILNQPFGN
ncbi:hypothetical protein HELRODRAFT_160541 [Helobdella robusta]|uniref:Uncharacterized protein n=1 Tax=Helobdella robusta TaxID=6412 RepID=T1EQE2_HELRO|nr:hypothetical protein HELRODRAFT_160541 [Helobdella robusta]ESO06374.1 hypothetical protein HELRODRAFT_160541 [Helobdella robusta]